MVLALKQISVISDLKGSEGMQEQRKSTQETVVQDGNFMLRPQTGWNVRHDDGDFFDPRDFSQLKLGLCQPLPQFYAEFSPAQAPS